MMLIAPGNERCRRRSRRTASAFYWRLSKRLRLFKLRVLITSARSNQPRRAWLIPNPMKSKSVSRWASVEIASFTPVSLASLQ